MEKPCAVDAPGVRSVLATGQKAAAYNLCVVAGTQWRHDRAYQETYNRVSHGAIGQIVGACARWNVRPIVVCAQEEGVVGYGSHDSRLGELAMAFRRPHLSSSTFTISTPSSGSRE